MKENQKKTSIKGYIGYVILFLVGCVSGFFAIQYVDLSFLTDLSPRLRFLGYVLLFVMIWIAYVLQIVIHEVGHLIFGLFSGYRFASFRVGKWMLLRKNGKLTVKRYFLAGTGGQCLMIPPERKDGNVPVVWFFLGGSILNFLFGVASLALAIWVNVSVWVTLFLWLNTAFAFLYALLNGIPMRTNLIANDGANAVALKKDTLAASEFCRHLLINAKSTEGMRLKDMPDEWFAFPTDEQLKNNAFAEGAVFFCNRLMDEGDFARAEERIKYLLDADSAMVGVHRKLLICDLMFCELIGERRSEILGELYTKEQYNFMRSMKEFPSVIRTEYAYAKLYLHDRSKMQLLRDAFEKCAKTYPNEGDIHSERELMAYINKTE